MDPVLLNDAARALHLLGLALGLGFAIKADHVASHFLFRPLDNREMDTLNSCHRTVTCGLALFWISGAVLLWLRTGLVLDDFSKKILLKLGVVSLLTANAVFIARFALPIMREWHHACLGELKTSVRMGLCMTAGVSAASWASALTLGVFSGLKVMDPIKMYEVIGAVYALGIGGALTVGMVAPAISAIANRRSERIIQTNAPEHQLQNLRPAS